MHLVFKSSTRRACCCEYGFAKTQTPQKWRKDPTPYTHPSSLMLPCYLFSLSALPLLSYCKSFISLSASLLEQISFNCSLLRLPSWISSISLYSTSTIQYSTNFNDSSQILICLNISTFFFLKCRWYTMVHADGSVSQTWNYLYQNGFKGFINMWPPPSATACKIIGCYAAFEAALQLLLPGKRVLGPVSPTGNQPVYKANGVAAYIVTLVTYTALWWFGIFDPTIVYDHLGEIFSALIFGSFIFCILLYIKGHVAPSSSDSGSSGNIILDFYWGMELYPRIGKHFDIKVFTNCRFGMMSWAVLAVTYCIKQFEKNGTIADSMLVNTALMLVYVTKFFWWEAGYWNTMDIAHDRAGFYICWGCLVWVPSVYTSPGMYLVNHPVNLGTQLAVYILVAGILCVYINYECDRQRQEFRRKSGKCLVWGKAPSKIVASYTTTSGDTKTSLLLTSGWWGLARHFHYVPEILAAFFWTVPALFNHFLPYFYVIFLTILLFDRAKRDDDRCRSKYGKYWKLYCEKVPYKIIPGIY